MGRKNRFRRKDINFFVILLAYLHRYVFLVSIFLLPLWLCRECFLLGVGVMMLLYGAYSFLGYKRKWKHIFCSFQNLHRKEMTPDDVRWYQMKKTDAYGGPILCGILGIVTIACHWLVMG